jgi:Pectinacetylesterase
MLRGLRAPTARRPDGTALAMLALVGLLAACGGSDDGADGAASTTTTADATPAEETAGETVNPQEGSAVAAGWERIAPGGDCQCSDGSEYGIFVHEADPTKVVLFLEDGGACFSAETCAPDSGVYHTSITEGPGSGGVFDFADERNPFADFSVVFVPYCTGDVHLGDATTEYAPDLTIHHKGYVNGTAALDHLVATFPDATEVVVIGESAGSVAAPFYAGLVSDRLPDAKITVLANGSGSYPDLPEINALLADAWGFDAVAPAWPKRDGVTAEQWSFPGLYIESGRHDPGIVFARIDYAYDDRQEMWYPIVGIPVGDLLERMVANESQIENAGVNLATYIGPGTEHTVLTDGLFFTESVGGTSLLDWVTRLLAGEPVDDVQCVECAMAATAGG